MAGRGDPDVVVVGGGPAGCATALWAGRRGLRVQLLHRPDRDAYRPGETLHPGIEPLLRQLGAEQALLGPGFPRHAGHTVEWSGGRSFQAYGNDATGPWLGFQACRQTLDHGLRATVRQAGITMTETTRVDPVVIRDGNVAGVRHSSGVTRASVVVDAAGARHWLARRLCLELRRCSPRLVARYGLVSGELPGRRTVPLLAADEGGWTWMAPVGSQRVAWVRLRVGGAQRRRTGVPSALARFGPCSRTGGADVTWRCVPATAGPGYVLVGDAAFVLDPLSSHGVLHAVMSGMMAAEMTAKSLLGGVPAAVTAAAYRRWSSAWFAADAARLRELYAAMSRPPGWESDDRDAGDAPDPEIGAFSAWVGR